MDVKRQTSNVKRACVYGALWSSLFSAVYYDWACPMAYAQSSLAPPAEVQVIDTPNDGGASLTILWAPSDSDSPDARYQILLGDGKATDPASLKAIAEFPANTRFVKDAKAAWWTREGGEDLASVCDPERKRCRGERWRLLHGDGGSA